MDYALRSGNYIVSKFLEFIFNTPVLTDMGCTMKLLNRKAYERLKDKFRVGDSLFNAEFILWLAITRTRFIEIPVNYSERTGKSSVTGNRIIAIKLGLRMILLILRYFIKSRVTFYDN
jgi:hypothetical protein